MVSKRLNAKMLLVDHAAVTSMFTEALFPSVRCVRREAFSSKFHSGTERLRGLVIGHLCLIVQSFF